MAANGVSGPHGTDAAGLGAAGLGAAGFGAAGFGAASARIELGEPSFHDVLRALNPLQYVPVVGTIYRLATGDAAPVGLRTAVSAVVGVLTGGPIGLIGSILGALAEQMFHVEDRLREALGPAAPVAGAVAAGASAPTHAQAEADLGAQPAGAATAAAAYRAAGLLGAV